MDTKRKPKQPAPLIVTSIRLDADTHGKLKALAEKERRSMSQQLRHLIDTALLETA